MKTRIHPALLTLLGILAWTQDISASTIVHTDKSSWKSQVLALTHAFQTEDFNDATLNAELTYRTRVGGVYQPEHGAGDDGGVWKDRVAKPSHHYAELTTTFEISGGAYAIGGNWDMTPAGHGSHVAISLLDVTGQVISSHEIPYLQGEFWGVVSDAKFSSVLLSSYHDANDLIQETYYLEDMVYSWDGPSPRASTQGTQAVVPLPAAFWLFTSSLMGLIGIGRWRNRPASLSGITSRGQLGNTE
ncbi:hypothetical protein [Imhoffiella purpurea]|uniref:Uncharacterized protein n=1 Tax=Imhoffiella purpurea TaxID=1249627 RepID=W9VHZ8_9GAMM|nr:hypothetical protein [Imhoffiella purpurea]EXJ16631.1 hypothetical protein D779_4184 [Imhoffiella purpurea]